MELSWILFQKIFSMMLMLAIGYALVKTGRLKAESSSVLSVIMLWTVTPCTRLTGLMQEFDAGKLVSLGLTLAASVLIHALYLILGDLSRKSFGMDTVDRNSLVYTNAGNLLVPLIIALLGKEYILYIIPYLIVETPLFWTDLIRQFDPRQPLVLKKILLNPNILAILAGSVLFFGQISLPKPALDLCESMTSLAGPVSMMMIGMIAAKLDLKSVICSGRLWAVSFGRLIVFPLIFIGLLALSGISRQSQLIHDAFLVTVLAASAPTAATVVQMASAYGSFEQAEQASAVNVLTTLLCVLTMPFLTALYQIWC
ncbi:MAG: AEC family transporter [Erysipelotrichaceae bacterium]|nr:AEC family transporter [Erysipelotrichaceae bacterium]